MKPEIFIEVNLIPAQFSKKRRKRLIRGEQILIALLSFVLLAVLLVRFYNDKLKQIEITQKEIIEVQQQIDANKDIKQQMKALEKKKSAIVKKITALKSIDIKRDKWIRILEIFERELPTDTWYDKLIQDKANLNTIKLNGKTYDFDNIGQYIRNLEDDTLIKSVTLNNVEQTIYRKENIFKFDMFIELKTGKKDEVE